MCSAKPVAVALLLALAATGSLAKPYYFFQEAAQVPAPAAAPGAPANPQAIAYDGQPQDKVAKMGKDIGEAFQQARERLEPSLQTAGESVAPLVKQVQEKGGEALSKVGQQVRGLFDKITSGGAEQPLKAATAGVQEAGQSVQQAASAAGQGVAQ